MAKFRWINFLFLFATVRPCNCRSNMLKKEKRHEWTCDLSSPLQQLNCLLSPSLNVILLKVHERQFFTFRLCGLINYSNLESEITSTHPSYRKMWPKSFFTWICMSIVLRCFAFWHKFCPGPLNYVFFSPLSLSLPAYVCQNEAERIHNRLVSVFWTSLLFLMKMSLTRKVLSSLTEFSTPKVCVCERERCNKNLSALMNSE